MKFIGDIPLREPDGALLRIGLPYLLEKSRQEGAKLNCLGGRIIFQGGVDRWGKFIRGLSRVAYDPRLAVLLLHRGKSGYAEEDSEQVDGVLLS